MRNATFYTCFISDKKQYALFRSIFHNFYHFPAISEFFEVVRTHGDQFTNNIFLDDLLVESGKSLLSLVEICIYIYI